MADANDSSVAGVLVIDERIVEIEQHRLRHRHPANDYAASREAPPPMSPTGRGAVDKSPRCTRQAASRLAFFRSCSLR